MAGKKITTRRRRKKNKKTRGRRGLFLVLLLAAVGAALFYGYGRLVEGMEAQAARFMEHVVREDRARAAALAAGEIQGLDELVELFQEPGLVYAGTGDALLTGLTGGRVDARFQFEGQDLAASLFLERRGWVWHIRAVPVIEKISGAYVQDEKAGQLHLFWQGRDKVVQVPGAPDLEQGTVIKARLVDDTAIAVEPLEKVVLSRLLRRTENELEGELEGVLPVRQPLCIYLSEQGAVGPGTPGDLVVGRERLSLYLDEDVIAAVKVEDPFIPETIRVVLRRNLQDLTDESLRHRWLSLAGDSGLILEDRISRLYYTFDAGRTLVIEPVPEGVRVTPDGSGSLIFNHRIFVTPREGGRIVLNNLQRDGWKGEAPVYRGVLEVVNQDGQLLLVNEPNLDQYLYTVVPSEMPLSFGPEPLKAQAVASRTYVFASLFSGRFSGYGAHVDDSVLSQVYNNYPEHDISREAVESTAGLVLFYNDAVADIRFYSTSSGYTANFHEVWHDPATGCFPAGPVPYLQAACQIPGQTVSLQNEAEVKEFLRRDDWPAYDREAPFFRWRVEMTAAEVEASLNHNLGPRYEAQPEFVLTREGDEYRSMEIPRNPLGNLCDIKVIQRGEGGNIMVLEVDGTNGTYRILKEYNIRFTLRPQQYLDSGSPIAVERHDGSTVNMTTLPSAFIYFDLVKNSSGALEKVIITGGGYGHGVGMSQFGARGMALQGYDFKGILRHYYPGTIIDSLYD